MLTAVVAATAAFAKSWRGAREKRDAESVFNRL
jgi:hypothetical protein